MFGLSYKKGAFSWWLIIASCGTFKYAGVTASGNNEQRMFPGALSHRGRTAYRERFINAGPNPSYRWSYIEADMVIMRLKKL